MQFGCVEMILTIASYVLLVSSMFPAGFLSSTASFQLRLDLHLLQVFVGGVLVAVVLHLAQVSALWGQHGVHLRDGHNNEF